MNMNPHIRHCVYFIAPQGGACPPWVGPAEVKWN